MSRAARTERERTWLYDVYLSAHGPMKLQCAKVLQQVIPNFGLGDALIFVAGKMPAVVLSGVQFKRARVVRDKLQRTGATVNLRSTSTSRAPLQPEKRTKQAHYRIRATGETVDFTNHTIGCEVKTRANQKHDECACRCHSEEASNE